MDIEDTIAKANFEEFSVYGGDCVNIAVALYTLFGGQYVASYASTLDLKECKPAHVAIRVDGTLFDGGGRTFEEALRERANYGVTDQQWSDIVVREIGTPSSEIHDPYRVKAVIEELRRAAD